MDRQFKNDRNLRVCVNEDDIESILERIAPQRPQNASYVVKNVQELDEERRRVVEEASVKIRISQE